MPSEKKQKELEKAWRKADEEKELGEQFPKLVGDEHEE